MKFRTLENAALNDNFGLMAKAMSGDMVFSLSQTTASPTVAECTAAAQVYNIVISLTTAAGELHSWYNGKVLLAIADDDNAGAASINPAAGERAMTNGVLEVKVTMSKATWTAGSKATLTVSDLATAGTGILGFVVADAKFVATVKSV
jgi:hypothetical protein